MSSKKRPPDSPRLLFIPENNAVWLAAIVGLSLSFAALLLIRQQLDAHEMLDFEWVAHNRSRALSHGLDNSLLAVHPENPKSLRSRAFSQGPVAQS